jgi:hypothetical protein
MKLFNQDSKYTNILIMIVIVLGLTLIIGFFVVVTTIVYRGIQLAL